MEGKMTHWELLDLLGKADCFVAPSRGEGWGEFSLTYDTDP